MGNETRIRFGYNKVYRRCVAATNGTVKIVFEIIRPLKPGKKTDNSKGKNIKR